LRPAKPMIEMITFLPQDLPTWSLGSARNDTAALLSPIEFHVVFDGLVLETKLCPTPRIRVTPSRLFASATA
jgi:hypothetical protein